MVQHQQVMENDIMDDLLGGVGKASTILAITLKTFGFIGIIDVNNVLTVLISLAALTYMIFRTWNEWQKVLENRRLKKQQKHNLRSEIEE